MKISPRSCRFADRERRRRAGAIRDERPGRPRRDRAVPRLPAGEQVVHDPGAPRVGQELRPEPDQPARRDAELQADAPAAVVHHLGHDAAAGADLRDDHALEVLGDVDHQLLDRLRPHAVDLLASRSPAATPAARSPRGASSRSGSTAAARRGRSPSAARASRCPPRAARRCRAARVRAGRAGCAT